MVACADVVCVCVCCTHGSCFLLEGLFSKEHGTEKRVESHTFLSVVVLLSAHMVHVGVCEEGDASKKVPGRNKSGRRRASGVEEGRGGWR